MCEGAWWGVKGRGDMWRGAVRCEGAWWGVKGRGLVLKWEIHFISGNSKMKLSYQYVD